MPDAFTHIAIPSIFHKLFRKPLILPVFLIGTVVPDYFRQFVSLLLISLPKYTLSIIIFHTILGAMLTSLLLCSFFRKDIRKLVFLNFFLGQLTHFLFDMCQSFLCGGKLYLLFPYRKSLEIGIFSESQWFAIFIFSTIVFTIYWLLFCIFRKSK